MFESHQLQLSLVWLKSTSFENHVTIWQNNLTFVNKQTVMAESLYNVVSNESVQEYKFRMHALQILGQFLSFLLCERF